MREPLSRAPSGFREEHFTNQWGIGLSGASIVSDLDWDTGVRAAYTFNWAAQPSNRELIFHPFADGISSLQLKDQNDVTVLINSLSCSIWGGCPP